MFIVPAAISIGAVIAGLGIRYVFAALRSQGLTVLAAKARSWSATNRPR
ncbi:hypothetical protein NB693_23450 [Pantoea ananatis]|nr:hypothetical protein [Pantoea ananatis]